MNSKSLQYHSSVNPGIDIPVLPTKGIFNAIISKITSFLRSSNLERSQAWYRTKRERAQAEQCQDIIGSLPVEEKLRLGMYRFMD